jgi:hypothetical protein
MLKALRMGRYVLIGVGAIGAFSASASIANGIVGASNSASKNKGLFDNTNASTNTSINTSANTNTKMSSGGTTTGGTVVNVASSEEDMVPSKEVFNSLAVSYDNLIEV